MEVVAGIIYYKDKILCVKRGNGKFPSTSFKYEFPGGKVEKGEALEHAIKREILEELDMEITVEYLYDVVEYSYPEFSLKLHVFVCKTKSEDFVMKEHVEYVWSKKEDLMELDWAAADKLIVEKLGR